MKQLLFILAIVATTIATRAQRPPTTTYRESIYRSYIGKQYPGFSFTTTSGENISSKTTKGKVVLLNFWFKDCSPCRTEMEWLNALYDSLKTDTSFQFISLAREKQEVLPGYIGFFHLSYPVVSLIECDKYNLGNGFPKNIILDKQGKIAYIIGGGKSDRQQSRQEVLGTLYNKIKELL